MRDPQSGPVRPRSVGELDWPASRESRAMEDACGNQCEQYDGEAFDNCYCSCAGCPEEANPYSRLLAYASLASPLITYNCFVKKIIKRKLTEGKQLKMFCKRLEGCSVPLGDSGIRLELYASQAGYATTAIMVASLALLMLAATFNSDLVGVLWVLTWAVGSFVPYFRDSFCTATPIPVLPC